MSGEIDPLAQCLHSSLYDYAGLAPQIEFYSCFNVQVPLAASRAFLAGH